MQNTTDRNIIGPDLNEYRGDVNYALLATQTPYAYLRGSGYGTGRFRIDRKFIEYVGGLRNVGVKTGAYHYAVPSTDLSTADAQCDNFIDLLQQAYGPGRYGDLFPVIDIEAPLDKSISTDALLDWVDRFRKRFERRTRRRMMLYTGAFFIELYNNFYHTKKGFILADMPLWIAMYPEIQPNPEYPRDQGGWTRWRMWQFTENGFMPGVNPPVDLNYGPESLDLLTQPRNVRDFRAVPVGQEIRLTWTPNTDVDLAGYNIFISSNYVTTLGKNASSYILKLANRPSPGEKYIMSIEAFDADGDFSQDRSSANVTFSRYIPVNYEESQDYQLEDRWNVDAETEVGIEPEIKPEMKPEMKHEMKPVEFNDPVDNLAKRFIKSVERNENMNVDFYDDFVETDNEFDDILYMKRLEAETAYKKYYGERQSKDKLGLSEIDDILYMKRLEAETAYKRYYGERQFKDKLGLSEIDDFRCEDDYEKSKEKTLNTCPKCIKYHEEYEEHHKNDYHDHEEHNDHKDKDYEHQHHMELEFNKCPCQKHDKYNDEYEHEYHDHHNCDEHADEEYHNKVEIMDDWDKKSMKCDRMEENQNIDLEDENQNIDLKDKNQNISLKDENQNIGLKDENQNIGLKDEDSKDYKRYQYKPSYDEIIRERYEGDRRRLENRDSNKYNMCQECVQPKNNCAKCEYIMQDMYLNNCDYGHKHHNKKHYDYKECNECNEYYSSKKKKKKHHKKHHR